MLEPWCLFQCKNFKEQFISSRISDQNSTLNSNKLHTDNNWNNCTAWNFNLLHFQWDRMWMVNMTGKTKSWPVNSPVSLDIVRWLVIIFLSPVFGTKVLTEDTIFTPLTGDRMTINFYVIIWATWQSGHLQGKGHSVICQLFLDCEYWCSPRGRTWLASPPAVKSSMDWAS